MTSLAPVKVSVQPLRGGTRRVVISCSCGRTEHLAAGWEPDAVVVAGLLERHRLASPRCGHRSPALKGAEQ